MKNLIIIFIVSIGIQVGFAQVKIGSNGNPDSSLILEVDNSTNQGVLIPEMSIENGLTNALSPIDTPAEGLIIYNPVSATTQLQKEGVYLWRNNTWYLIADNNNMVNDLVLLNNNLNYTVLDGNIGVFNNMHLMNVPLFSNNIPDAYYDANKYIHLPHGGYTVQVILDYEATNMGSTTIANGNGVNVMNFQGKLVNPNTGEQFGNTKSANVTIRNQVKRGQIILEFNFATTSPKSFIFELANASGGSYRGTIKILKYKLHVQSGK